MSALFKTPHARLNEALLNSFAASWRAEGLAEATLGHYLRHLRALARVTGKSFLDVDRADLEERVHDVIVATSASYAHYHARAFRRFFAWLAEEQEIEVNPAARVKLPKVPTPTTKVASADDIRTLLRTTVAKVPSFNQYRDRAIIHVLRCTGMRISEVARIELEHVDLASAIVVVPISKTRKPRYVMLDGIALRAVSAYVRRLPQGVSGPLWRTSNGRTLSVDGVKQAFDRRAKQARLSVTPHQLRRAFSVNWLRDGGSQASLQALAGWNSPAMVARYVSGMATELALDEFRRLRSASFAGTFARARIPVGSLTPIVALTQSTTVIIGTETEILDAVVRCRISS